jgi:hypothetical protein
VTRPATDLRHDFGIVDAVIGFEILVGLKLCLDTFFR